MFADLLHSMSDDANDAEGIAELVVTALGTSGRHYICWKTRSGEYKQRSHGLPRRLHEWLFPADGETRDFETLQVILSGEDEFWASDKYGDIRSDSTDAQKQLRRSLTFSEDAMSTNNRRRRLSRSRDLARDTERPRSSTLPSFLPTGSPPSGKVPRMQVNHDRTPSVDKLRRLSVTPPAVQQQKRRWTARPRSIGYYGLEELAVLEENPAPKQAPPPSSFPSFRGHLPNHHCTCGCHRSGISIQVPPPAVTRPRPAYADACVQTDPMPEPEPPRECNNNNNSYQHHRVSSVTTISSGEETEVGSQRSSFETTITRPDPESLKSEWRWEPRQNPIIMGRMQDYFRSKTYILGQALVPRGMG
ncbi:hypothetical protein F5X96DRAFT_614808 [Biscogniauxia mediterranea]|nr:hypothetical protein F5X96DRAFT_614808 [Biscogniauxia mediterranea]